MQTLQRWVPKPTENLSKWPESGMQVDWMHLQAHPQWEGASALVSLENCPYQYKQLRNGT